MNSHVYPFEVIVKMTYTRLQRIDTLKRALSRAEDHLKKCEMNWKPAVETAEHDCRVLRELIETAPHPDDVTCPHCHNTRRFANSDEANDWMEQCVSNPRNKS